MGRKHFFLDTDAFLRDLNKRFEEEEFLSDFKNFLAYIVKNKIKVTPECKWIPMKHLYAINGLLKNPLKLDDSIGDKIYKTREECYAGKIYFIDLLACASECIYINKKDRLMPGPEYNNFLNKDGFNKKRWLIFAWWFNLDWDSWMSEGDFGKTLQDKALDIIPYLKEISNIRHRVDFKEFTKALVNNLNLKWNASSQGGARGNMEWGIKCCILEPLSWFDIIELCYTKESDLGIKDIKGFYIKPMGKLFLDDLVKMGERIKDSLAKKSNCNNN